MTMNNKYTIGIDIGPEVTMVSRSPGYGSEKVSQILLKHKQYTLGREIRTGICKIDNEWSLCTDSINCVRVTKDCWLDDTQTREKEIFIVFIQLLFQAIIESDPVLIYDESIGIKNFDLIVAVPGYWENFMHNACIEYREFLKTECRLPVDCSPNEAEARFRISNSLKFNDMQDRIFVIDLNIDTIEFTCLPCWSNNYNLCWSLNLGSQHIIDAVMSKILKTETNAQNLQRVIDYRKTLKDNANIVALLSLFLKEQIKRYFLEVHENFAFRVTYQELTPCWAGPIWEPCIKYEVSKEEFKEVLFGYMQQIKDAIHNAKIRLFKSEWKPHYVFITGTWGVTFSNSEITSYIEESFGVKVYFDSCPDISISNGLALTKIIRVH